MHIASMMIGHMMLYCSLCAVNLKTYVSIFQGFKLNKTNLRKSYKHECFLHDHDAILSNIQPQVIQQLCYTWTFFLISTKVKKVSICQVHLNDVYK